MPELVDIGRTLFEHNELASRFGYLPTACPSDRYDRAFALWEAGVNPLERLERLEKLAIANGISSTGAPPPGEDKLKADTFHEKALKLAADGGWSIMLTAQQAQYDAALAKQLASNGSGTGDGVDSAATAALSKALRDASDAAAVL